MAFLIVARFAPNTLAKSLSLGIVSPARYSPESILSFKDSLIFLYKGNLLLILLCYQPKNSYFSKLKECSIWSMFS